MMTSFKGLVIVFGLLLNQNSLAFTQDVIRLTNGEWPPYTSENLKDFGIFSHIVTEVFALEKINVEYGFYPWKRAYEYAKSGSWEGSVCWYWSEERSKDVYFSDPVMNGDEMFFYLKDHPFEWKTIEDLKGKQIGAVIGYFAGEEFQKAEQSGLITVERIATDVQNFKKLLSGRLDIMVMNLYVGYDLIRKHFSPQEAEKVTHHPQAINTGALHLILSKQNLKNSARVVAFNRGLAKLKTSGKIDHYLQDVIKGGYDK
ncbi:MAG: transporter substrate-binding domain-containing protein [Desulfobacterales bacterium]|nr:transporter substrate-binding domain-containing protein [Desulfobacterales bacterium]